MAPYPQEDEAMKERMEGQLKSAARVKALELTTDVAELSNTHTRLKMKSNLCRQRARGQIVRAAEG